MDALEFGWHARRDSNPRPPGSKPGALSTELRARGVFAESQLDGLRLLLR